MTYQQGPSAALLGTTSSSSTNYQLNGALRNGDKSQQFQQQQQKKKRDSKDIKEWYLALCYATQQSSIPLGTTNDLQQFKSNGYELHIVKG
nr:unnamed protein product [Callosobruchus analis]